MEKATEFRERACDCRRQAELAMKGTSKEQWLKIADQWEQLAQQAERFPDAFR
jgi:hypothetical protein